MGVHELWPLVRRKGYDPTAASLPHQRHPGTVRVDVSSCLFAAIGRAYLTHPPDLAALSFERALTDLVGHLRPSVVCYLDGLSALEKAATHEAREDKRKTVLDSAEEGIIALRERVEQRRPATKQQHLAVKKPLGKSFRWSLEDRQQLREYLHQQGWRVVLSPCEADVAIARDYQEGDVVLTKDCDFLAYAQVKTVWRLVTKSKLLVYQVPDMLKAIGLTRIQLTALCVASKNGYDSNVYRLGTATNYAIMKAITGNDVHDTVRQYHVHRDVLRRNNTDISFEFSLRVFVSMEQTAAPASPLSVLNTRHQALQLEYEQLCAQLKVLSEEATVLRQESKAAHGGTPNRHKPTQKFNQFRTIDLLGSSAAPAESATDIEMVPTDNNVPDKAGINLQPAHPALARTRVPRHRPRYSPKERVRIIRHPCPPAMKLYKWKEHKKKPEATSSTRSDAPEKPAKRKKAAPDKTHDEIRANISTTRKNNLVRMLAVEHPIVTLQVGTLQANAFDARLSVQNELGVQVDGLDESGTEIAREVARILRKAAREAASAKRSAQALVGGVIQRAVIDDGLVERALTQGREAMSDDDKALLNILDLLCPPISRPKGEGKSDQVGQHDAQDEDEPPVPDEEDKSDQDQFLSMLLQLQHTGVCHLTSKHHESLKALVMLAFDHGVGDPWVESFTPARKEFPARPLVASSAAEMSRELRRHFRKGALEIQEKLQNLIDKGILPPDKDISIHYELPAILNFAHLNGIFNNRYTAAPLSPIQQPYILFSEANLLLLFWSSEMLKEELRKILNMPECNRTQSEAWRLLAQQGPGYLLTRLVSSVGRGPRRGAKSYKRQTTTMTLDEMREDYATIRDIS
ncbi:hypothetical protein BGZ68_001938, partial [Mortierella alpina]